MRHPVPSRETGMILSPKACAAAEWIRRPRSIRCSSRSGVVAMPALSGNVLSAQSATVHDSAGIRIVSNPARSAAPAVFRLGDKPLIRVGGLESNPDLEFDFKSGYVMAVRLSNGGLVVGDKVRLQFFDANSKRTRIPGRFGSGPQEFQIAGTMCLTRGDTLVVQDEPNGRLAIVDARAMNFVRTIPRMGYGSLPAHACFGDGRFLMRKGFGPTATVERLLPAILVSSPSHTLKLWCQLSCGSMRSAVNSWCRTRSPMICCCIVPRGSPLRSCEPTMR